VKVLHSEKQSYKGLTVKKGRKLSAMHFHITFDLIGGQTLTDNFTCGFKGFIDLNTSPVNRKSF